jgi:hypothetical protein
MVWKNNEKNYYWQVEFFLYFRTDWVGFFKETKVSRIPREIPGKIGKISIEE